MSAPRRHVAEAVAELRRAACAALDGQPSDPERLLAGVMRRVADDLEAAEKRDRDRWPGGVPMDLERAAGERSEP